MEPERNVTHHINRVTTSQLHRGARSVGPGVPSQAALLPLGATGEQQKEDGRPIHCC